VRESNHRGDKDNANRPSIRTRFLGNIGESPLNVPGVLSCAPNEFIGYPGCTRVFPSLAGAEERAIPASESPQQPSPRSIRRGNIEFEFDRLEPIPVGREFLASLTMFRLLDGEVFAGRVELEAEPVEVGPGRI
jgi:hypothetical protein